MMQTVKIRPRFQNLNAQSFDLSNTVSKEQLDKLGFKGRFWSVPHARKISFKKLTANVLCEPKSYREIFILSGIVGVPVIKSLANQLHKKQEMDDGSYQYFLDNIAVVEAYQIKKNWELGL